MPPLPIKKPVAAKPAAAEDNVIALASSVSVSRSFTVPMGEFAGVKFGVTVTGTDYQTVSEQVDAYMAAEAEKAGAQYNELTGAADADDDAGTDTTEGAPETDAAGPADDGEITAEAVMGMNRDALIALVTANDLAVDPDDYTKNANGLADFRQAVVDAAFSEGEEQITEEAIREMDRPTLVKFVNDNGIEVDHKKLPKLSALQNAVVEALSAAAEDDTDTDAAADDAPADDAADGYTETMLNAMNITDLKAIFAEWELGAFPAGPPVKQKPTAIKAILAAQAG